jgi:hypothetical protein
MKKEVDTYKLTRLFDAFHGAMLWAWYLFGIILGAVLWFFPLPQSRIQTFAFAAFFVIYTLLSVSIKKLASIRTELE